MYKGKIGKLWAFMRYLSNCFIKTPIRPLLGVIHKWDSSSIGIRASFKAKIIINPWISNMEPHQEGDSIGRPPFLIGENYSHWKVRLQYFLKMQSEKVWNTVEFGLPPPKVLDRKGRLTNVIKHKLEWDRWKWKPQIFSKVFK